MSELYIPTLTTQTTNVTLTPVESVVGQYALIPARALRSAGVMEWELFGSCTAVDAAADTQIWQLYYGAKPPAAAAGTAVFGLGPPSREPQFVLQAGDYNGAALWTFRSTLTVASTSGSSTVCQARSTLTWTDSATDGLSSHSTRTLTSHGNLLVINNTGPIYLWWTARTTAISLGANLFLPRACSCRVYANHNA